VADPSNCPGARELAVSWFDSQGNLWLFGGRGIVSANDWGYLNDFWKFDPVTVEWTWVSGGDSQEQPGVYGTKGLADPSNCPGAREGAVSWFDSQGNLWLFGGGGVVSENDWGGLNDLWKFDPVTVEWTWVSGTDSSNQPGVYGTKGVADPSNCPGAREGAVSWFDSQGNLWLFGGVGIVSANDSGYLNDLWKFDPVTVEWTWVSGSNIADQPGVYGSKGLADPSNVPGGRLGAVSWIDAHNQLWLFGGGVFAGSWGPAANLFNDLWKFDPATLEWAWVSGTDSLNQPGVYGTKGVADPSNCPWPKQYAVSWIDPEGHLWLFGGYGLDSEVSLFGSMNDLWRGNR
jgi:N-acetylneuraminic acid mutarotase